MVSLLFSIGVSGISRYLTFYFSSAKHAFKGFACPNRDYDNPAQDNLPVFFPEEALYEAAAYYQADLEDTHHRIPQALEVEDEQELTEYTTSGSGSGLSEAERAQIPIFAAPENTQQRTEKLQKKLDNQQRIKQAFTDLDTLISQSPSREIEGDQFQETLNAHICLFNEDQLIYLRTFKAFKKPSQYWLNGCLNRLSSRTVDQNLKETIYAYLGQLVRAGLEETIRHDFSRMPTMPETFRDMLFEDFHSHTLKDPYIFSLLLNQISESLPQDFLRVQLQKYVQDHQQLPEIEFIDIFFTKMLDAQKEQCLEYLRGFRQQPSTLPLYQAEFLAHREKYLLACLNHHTTQTLINMMRHLATHINDLAPECFWERLDNNYHFSLWMFIQITDLIGRRCVINPEDYENYRDKLDTFTLLEPGFRNLLETFARQLHRPTENEKVALIAYLRKTKHFQVQNPTRENEAPPIEAIRQRTQIEEIWARAIRRQQWWFNRAEATYNTCLELFRHYRVSSFPESVVGRLVIELPSNDKINLLSHAHEWCYASPVVDENFPPRDEISENRMQNQRFWKMWERIFSLFDHIELRFYQMLENACYLMCQMNNDELLQYTRDYLLAHPASSRSYFLEPRIVIHLGEDLLKMLVATRLSTIEGQTDLLTELFTSIEDNMIDLRFPARLFRGLQMLSFFSADSEVKYFDRHSNQRFLSEILSGDIDLPWEVNLDALKNVLSTLAPERPLHFSGAVQAAEEVFDDDEADEENARPNQPLLSHRPR